MSAAPASEHATGNDGAWPPRLLVGALAAGAVLFSGLLFLYFFGAHTATITGTPGALPQNEFAPLWAAGRLAIAGTPFQAFDTAALGEAMHAGSAHGMHWLYPPVVLVAIVPFGMLPFMPAWLLWTGLGIIAFSLALRPFTPGRTDLRIAMVFAPAALSTILYGQITLFVAALFLAAMAALRSSQPILAGVLIGCLTIKPQLWLLLPVALVAASAWTTIAAATATAIALAAAPSFVIGFEYWPLWLSALDTHSQAIITANSQNPRLIGVYAVMRQLEIDHGTALALHALATLAIAAAIWRLWRQPDTDPDSRAAILLAGAMLSSPYLWEYNALFGALAAFFALRAGTFAGSGGLIVFTILWLGAMPFVLLEWFGVDRGPFAGLTMISLTGLTAALCLWRTPGQPIR